MNTELKELLQSNVVNVTFTKKDGTERTMPCTLSESFIPAEFAPKNTDTERKRSEAAQAVYVTDANGWRSFRWDSVISYEIAKDNV